MTHLHADIGRATILGGLRFVLPLVGYAFFYPILLRESGAEVLGLWSLFATISMYINLSDIGFSLHLVREAVTTRPRAELRHVFADYLTARRIYLIAAPPLMILAPALVGFVVSDTNVGYDRNGLLLASELFVISAIVALIAKLEQAVLRGGNDNGVVQIATGVRQVAPLPFGIAGAFGGWPIEGFAAGVLIGDTVRLLFYRWRIRQRHQHWVEAAHDLPWAGTWNRLVRMFRRSGFLYLQSVAQFVRDPVFRLVITATLGLGAAAVFEIANRVSLLLFNVITAGFTALYPSFSTLKRSGDREGIRTIFLHAFLIMAGLGMWGMGQMFIFADAFFDIWLGGADGQLVTATQILLIWYGVQLLFVPLWHLENALGYEKFVCLAVAVHGAGALSFLLLDLSLERMLALWVVLGVCAYGILGLAGSEISHQLSSP